MNIYLVGFMGSGKSGLGDKIATRLNFKFSDLDKEIEISEKKSISEIFHEKGEEHFRKLEKQMLFRTVNNDNNIIALGGGACCTDQRI